MKKSNLFFVLLTAIIVMSCSKDETTMSIPQDGNAVEFGTYVGRDAQTRASVLDDNALKLSGFGIWGYYTNTNDWNTTEYKPNFMWNQKVEFDATWKYTPIKYWPTTQGDKLTFFAYAPYESAPTLGTDNGIVLSGNAVQGTPTITFTIKDDAAKMVDLVTANAMNNVTSDAPAPVNFTFKHVLSRVNFEALALDETEDGDLASGTIINITSVKIDAGGEFYQSGIYTLTTTSPAVTGKWSNYSETSADLDISNISAITAVSYGAKTGSMYNTSGVVLTSSTNVVPLFKTVDSKQQYLFLIPKEGGLTGTDGNKFKVTFTYDIVTADANLDLGYSITSATKTVALPAGGLQTGKAYKYTFKFGVDRVVVGAVTVSGWDAADDEEVTIDYTDLL